MKIKKEICPTLTQSIILILYALNAWKERGESLEQDKERKIELG